VLLSWQAVDFGVRKANVDAARAQAAQANAQTALTELDVTAAAADACPRNIRELQNIGERSVILCTGDTFSIDEAWLSSQGSLRPDGSDPLPLTLQDQEKDMIESALAKSRGQVAGPRGAATMLGIPPSTLESKIKQLRIDKRRFTSPYLD
jgi:DNA-binding NtrC family response regulator